MINKFFLHLEKYIFSVYLIITLSIPKYIGISTPFFNLSYHRIISLLFFIFFIRNIFSIKFTKNFTFIVLFLFLFFLINGLFNSINFPKIFFENLKYIFFFLNFFIVFLYMYIMQYKITLIYYKKILLLSFFFIFSFFLYERFFEVKVLSNFAYEYLSISGEYSLEPKWRYNILRSTSIYKGPFGFAYSVFILTLIFYYLRGLKVLSRELYSLLLLLSGIMIFFSFTKSVIAIFLLFIIFNFLKFFKLNFASISIITFLSFSFLLIFGIIFSEILFYNDNSFLIRLEQFNLDLYKINFLTFLVGYGARYASMENNLVIDSLFLQVFIEFGLLGLVFLILHFYFLYIFFKNNKLGIVFLIMLLPFLFTSTHENLFVIYFFSGLLFCKDKIKCSIKL